MNLYCNKALLSQVLTCHILAAMYCTSVDCGCGLDWISVMMHTVVPLLPSSFDPYVKMAFVVYEP
jgi:hypothetical protein